MKFLRIHAVQRLNLSFSDSFIWDAVTRPGKTFRGFYNLELHKLNILDNILLIPKPTYIFSTFFRLSICILSILSANHIIYFNFSALHAFVTAAFAFVSTIEFWLRRLFDVTDVDRLRTEWEGRIATFISESELAARLSATVDMDLMNGYVRICLVKQDDIENTD